MEASLNLCAGELIEVLSKEEILATLDQNGCYESVPFMPEMFQYCGRRIRVYKRAHKTCDYITHTGLGRGLPNAVHLEGSRCDGSAHGTCQAQCMIYWKEVWLKRVLQTEAAEEPQVPRAVAAPSANGRAKCSELTVLAACTSTEPGSPEPIYRCQATQVPTFSKPLAWWDIRHYVEDYRSGNVRSIGEMLPRFIYRTYDNLINLGIGLGPLLRWLYDVFQKWHGGIPYPAREGTIPAGAKTPTCTIGIQPGEYVRVKSYKEILKTLDATQKNRGMAFGAEMAPHCGKVFRVLSRVNRIVDEKTGKMLQMKNPCIVLEGSVCTAVYNKNTIFCPKATYAYWREIWLERTDDLPALMHSENRGDRACPNGNPGGGCDSAIQIERCAEESGQTVRKR